MGGHGSGRTGGRPTYERTASYVLTIGSFVRGGLRAGLKGTVAAKFGTSDDPLAVSIVVDTTDETALHLDFTHTRRNHAAEGEAYFVPLETTAQRFGGLRWWFRCPQTGQRCTKLFLPLGGHRFLSRYAWRLGYASQREDARGRAQLQARKISRSLGNADHWIDGPPPKPKWMRWSTYERKAQKLEIMNARFDRA